MTERLRGSSYLVTSRHTGHDEMSVPWFFARTIPDPGEAFSLDGGELRHLRSARRMTNGEAVVVFDGAGIVAEATVETSATETTLHTLSRSIQPRPLREIHLISALPKGDRSATMLSMATQLGMTSFSALQSDRAVVMQGGTAEKRWRRIMIEACKQSRRAWLPAILDQVDVSAVAERYEVGFTTHVAHPGGESGFDPWRGSQTEGLRLVVGPEGGLTEKEIKVLVTSGARLVDLGPGILRIETAAVAMLTLASQAQLPNPSNGSSQVT